MFIAHLPAGYLLACPATDRLTPADRRAAFIPLLIGSVFPDVDMLYFYLIDDHQHPHHHYWTHLPVFWLAAFIASLLPALLLRTRSLAIAATSFTGGIALHLFLDTPCGGIRWLYPWSDHSFYFISVPATHGFWVWNFVLHWFFLLEIAICVAAVVLFYQRNRRPVAA